MTCEYSVNIPADKSKRFRKIVKELGGDVSLLQDKAAGNMQTAHKAAGQAWGQFSYLRPPGMRPGPPGMPRIFDLSKVPKRQVSDTTI